MVSIQLFEKMSRTGEISLLHREKLENMRLTLIFSTSFPVPKGNLTSVAYDPQP